MSVFGPNQVGELIIGDAVATETTIATFINSASNKEIAILAADGGNVAVNKKFKFLQKTAGDAGKGLNYEFSDVIDPKKIKRIVARTYAAETQKSVRITGFDGNVVANTTYSVEVRIFEDGGTLSPENFTVVSGYYVTGSNIAGVVSTDIRDAIVTSLNANLVKRGNSELVITTPDATETDILITGKFQDVFPGKITGRQIVFNVTAKVFNDVSILHENLGTLSTTIESENNSGEGTGKYAVNLEWFTKGYKYESYRATGYPADFGDRTPYYASKTGEYRAIHIAYFDDRSSPSVETQEKSLTILVSTEEAADSILDIFDTLGLSYDSNITRVV